MGMPGSPETVQKLVDEHYVPLYRYAYRLTGSLGWLFTALAAGLVLYGLTILAAVASGAWFRLSTH